MENAIKMDDLGWFLGPKKCSRISLRANLGSSDQSVPEMAID